MSKTVIGRNLPLYKGDYDKSKTYDVYDVVLSDGSSYVSKKKNNVGNALTNTEFWQLLAKQGEKPKNGVDYNTEQEKEEFKQAVVEDSKTDMDSYTETKKAELNTHTDTKKSELDTYKSNLESEMTTTKNSLVEEIENAQSGFDENVTAKINEFNENATEQTNTFNTNAEQKTTEYNNNHTAKIDEFDAHAEEKIAEFDNNADSVENELTELAGQMPWNTTDIQESIHVEDAWKYSRNKLFPLGNLKQETREGYNLVDTSKVETQTKNGVTITNNGDGTLTFNGTSTASTSIVVPVEEFVLPAGAYTKYVTKNTDVGSNLTLSLGYNGAISITSSQPTSANYLVTKELTEDTTVNQLRIYFQSGTVFSNYKMEWMFLKGTYTVDTIPAYEQYGAMPSIEYPSMPTVVAGVQTIRKCKKNLFNDSNVKSAFVSNTVGTVVKYNSSTATNTYVKACYLTANKQYILSRKVNTPASEVSRSSVVCDNNETILEQIYFDVTTNPVRFKPNTTGWLHLSIDVNTTDIQIEEGDTATDYEPYTEETFTLDLEDKELAKIKDTNGNVVARDKFVYKDEKWQIERNVDKIVFEGTENWIVQTAYEGFYRYLTNVKKDNLCASTGSVLGINSHFTQRVNQGHSGYEYLYVQSTSTTGVIYIQSKEFSTPEELKAFLVEQHSKNIPVTVYYVATVSTYEDCTESQAEVLDKLHKLSLAQGTNNIFVESENGVTVELQLEYMQDNNLIREQEHQEFRDEIDVLKQAILSLGGNI